MLIELNQAGIGEKVKIMEIKGGHGLKQKLFLRGLIEGKIIRIVSNSGPVTVEVERNTIAVGRGMAQKIAVERC
jgi:ferrous iron transport protein A